jgi:hypothetical protein
MIRREEFLVKVHIVNEATLSILAELVMIAKRLSQRNFPSSWRHGHGTHLSYRPLAVELGSRAGLRGISAN